MSLALEPDKTALILIDLQKGILSMQLSPYDADEVLANTVALGRRFAEAGGIVVLVHVAFAQSFVDRLRQPVDAPAAGAAWRTTGRLVGVRGRDPIIASGNYYYETAVECLPRYGTGSATPASRYQHNRTRRNCYKFWSGVHSARCMATQLCSDSRRRCVYQLRRGSAPVLSGNDLATN